MHESKTLSDNQRRIVCRIVFLVLCALPTSLSFYTLFHQPGPDHWENLVRAQLGIPIQIAAVETPVPFKTVLRGVRIPSSVIQATAELESDLLIDEIQINSGDRQNVVTFVQPIELPLKCLTQLANKCNNHLEQFDLDQKVWQFDFAKIVISDDVQADAEFQIPPVVLQPVGIRARQELVDGVAIARCDLVAKVDPIGSDVHPKLGLVLRKFPSRDRLEFRTADGSIPARLLRFWQPEMNWLGNGCRFSGMIDIEDADAGIAEVSGQLTGVELDRLSAPYSLGVRGSCDVYDIDCRLEGDEIVSAGMRIYSPEQLSIGGSLLTACRQLGIQTEPLEQHGDYSFPNLDLHVDIEMGRLLLSGNQGSVISKNANGDALAMVYHADATVHNLAEILTADLKSSEAISFLKKFRTAQRTARQPQYQNSRF